MQSLIEAQLNQVSRHITLTTQNIEVHLRVVNLSVSVDVKLPPIETIRQLLSW